MDAERLGGGDAGLGAAGLVLAPHQFLQRRKSFSAALQLAPVAAQHPVFHVGVLAHVDEEAQLK